jgi:siroheme synthase-like protein
MTAGPEPLWVRLRLEGRRCVVVGAGTVGARRAGALAAAGADVVVVAPEASEAVLDLARAGTVELRPRSVTAEDLVGAAIVVAATDSPAVNERVAGQARSAGALVNRADRAAAGDLDLPSVLERGPVTIAVSTAGRAPAVTRWLSERLDDGLDGLLGLDAASLGLLVDVVAEVRAELAAGTGVTAGSLDWRSGLDRTMLDLIHSGRGAEAKERLQACLLSS